MSRAACCVLRVLLYVSAFGLVPPPSPSNAPGLFWVLDAKPARHSLSRTSRQGTRPRPQSPSLPRQSISLTVVTSPTTHDSTSTLARHSFKCPTNDSNEPTTPTPPRANSHSLPGPPSFNSHELPYRCGNSLDRLHCILRGVVAALTFCNLPSPSLHPVSVVDISAVVACSFGLDSTRLESISI